MKNLLFALVAGCLSVLAMPNGTYAQYSNNVTTPEQAKNSDKMDKSLTYENGHTVTPDAYSIKAEKNLRKSYKAVNNVKWAKVSAGFIAGFTADGIKNTIFYDKKGQWEGSIKGYTEDKFSRDIRHIVKRTYYDYSIIYVEEIETAETEGLPVYLVHLKDANTLKIVRVSDGDMDVYQEFNIGS